MGLFTRTLEPPRSSVPLNSPPKERLPARLVDPYDETHSLTERVRSYLHVNCAHCHQAAVGGNAEIDFRVELSLEETKAIGISPLQGKFGLSDPRIIIPGDPYRSVLMFRLAKTGRGRMPRGSTQVDRVGIEMLYRWIEELGSDVREETSDISETLAEEGHASAIEELLASTDHAMRLHRWVEAQEPSDPLRHEVIRAGAHHPEALVRELFEAYLPPDERLPRRTDAVTPQQVLKIPGDLARGKKIFFHTDSVQCNACHRIEGQGGKVGPELSKIGRKRTSEHLLQSILEPSREIEPQYLTWMLQTIDGQAYSGLLESKTDRVITLRDSRNKQIQVPAAEVEILKPQEISLMPELLMQDMSASEIADLLAYLSSLQ